MDRGEEGKRKKKERWIEIESESRILRSLAFGSYVCVCYCIWLPERASSITLSSRSLRLRTPPRKWRKKRGKEKKRSKSSFFLSSSSTIFCCLENETKEREEKEEKKREKTTTKKKNTPSFKTRWQNCKHGAARNDERSSSASSCPHQRSY